ncbi:hypothetical protein Asp14428_68800 [Actinoplanes sp. NBRC 14428]|nr:hypothetical protein Asp14428_68800 [Actinoplanes sp. NBRC 14428]
MLRRTLAGLSAALVIGAQLSFPGAASAAPEPRAAAAVPASPADYAYDGAGQLRGVSQSADGAAATYAYDDAGNPTSTTRSAAGTVTVSSLNPSRAPIGAKVVVSGTGFSATAGSNTVKFNGTTATVTAASRTRLTVTVPSGTTSGTVSVAVGTATATSGQAFTVVPGTPAPAVTGFSPSTGDIGASVTITGTGFSTVKAENNVSIGRTRARVTAASATSLTVTVPAAAGSGKITVVTPGGSATSGGEFLAVPERYTAANVGATGVLTVDGTPTTVTLGTAGKIAVLRFAGVKGQRLSLGITGSTLGDVVLYGYTPHNAPFGRDEYNDPWWVSKLLSGWALPPLPVSGTYQIAVRPTSATATGSLTATLSSRLPGALSLTGAGTTVTFTRPGQLAELSLDTTAGQSISLAFSDSTLTTTEVVTQTVGPDGTVQRWAADSVTGRTERVRSVLPFGSLHYEPGAGRSTVLVGPSGGGTGKLTVTASPQTDLGAFSFGTAKVVNAPRPAQEFLTTFSATAGQNLAIQLAKYTPAYRPTARIIAPDGTLVGQRTLDPDWTNLPSLPATGTYRMILFANAGTGTFEASLWVRQDGGTATTTGAAVRAAFDAGRATEITVNGTAGQNLSLAFGTGTAPEGGVRVRAVTPAGQILYDYNIALLIVLDLPITTTGAYRVVVSPLVSAAGNADVTLAQESAATLAVGAAATVTAGRLGQRTRLSFSGTAGQRLSLVTTGGTFTYVTTVRVYRPDGTQLVALEGYSTDFKSLAALPSSGTYQIVIEPYAETGTETFRIAEAVGGEATAVDGATRTMTVAATGRYADTTLSLTANQRLSLGFTGWTFAAASVRLRLTGPAGELLADGMLAKDVNYDLTVPATGTYRLALIPSDWGTGALTLTASTQRNAGAFTLNTAKALSFPRAGQSNYATFAGTAGQLLSLSYTSVTTPFYPYLTVRKPDGSVLGIYAGAATISIPALPVTGTYELLISPYSGSGAATATLRTRTAAASGTAAAPAPGLAPMPVPKQAAAPAAKKANPRSKARDGRGQPVFSPLAGSGRAAGGETWQPGATALNGQGWVTGRNLPVTAPEPLRAGLGVTAVSGRVLTIEDKPLPGVTVSVDGTATRTDATGRFLLTGITPGHRVLRVDGSSANTPGRTFGLHDIGVDVAARDTTVLPYTIWLSKLDTLHTVRFPSPTKGEVTIRTPAIPGLEVRLPAGAVVRDAGGRTVTELGITAIPVDRAPFPLPKSQVPSYFTVQPGSSYVFPTGARVVYPNFTHARPGTSMDFWHYDPAGKGWFVYGTGTVTRDGKRVEPDKGTEVYQFTGAMLITPGAAPPPAVAPTPGGSVRAADPVDLRTGLLIDEHTDLAVDDVLPLNLTRTYQQSDTGKRAFGIGTNFTYGLDLYSTNRFYECWLILPDGGRIHFTRTSPGGFNYQDAVLAADPTPTEFNGSTLTWNGDGWDLALRDGTVYVFGDEAPLQAVRDRFGNTVTITRGEPTDFSDGVRRNSGPITQVTSPNGKWIKFTYDSSSRVTRAEDVLGRAVSYTYTADGRLETVTDVNDGVTRYTYESGRLKTITDPRNTVYLTNQYDAGGRVAVQTMPGNAEYRLAYGTGFTELTDPRGHVRRVTFDSAGFAVTDTAAYGTSLAQTTTITRHPATHLPTAVVDALNRRTEYTYDAYGNTRTITRMAGTAKAVTTTIDRLGPFDQVSKVTDPLQHSTGFGYKADGALQTVTDPMNRTVVLDTDESGLVRKRTDTAGKPTTYDYALGDLVRATDPLGNATTVFQDAAGRRLRGTDPLGNTTAAAYDNASRPAEVTDPLGRTTAYGYDPNGNLHTVTDARRNTTVYDWDTSDRLAKITDPLHRITAYSYDPNGNLATVTTARNKQTAYAYDDLDRTGTIRYGVSGQTQESTTTYTYDAANRTRTIADTAGGTTTITPDDLDRVASVESPQGTVGYTYDAADRRATMTVPGQAQTVYGYNNADQLTTITRGTQTVGIGYDTAGRRGTLTVPAGITQTYGYDDASRVTSINYTRGTTALGTLTYALDPLGRPLHVDGTYARVTLPPASGPVTYDAADQRSGNTYDDDGNVSSDGTTTYAWNARNQLTTVSRAGLTVTYGYDAAGRRASRTAAGATNSYLYDGLNAVQQRSGSTITADLLTGATDEVFARNSRSLLTDALGSTLASADTASVPAEYTYDPFGATTVSGDDQANPTRFTGREDDGDGLYYYRSRYYSTSQQRFLSRDPIGLASGDTNPYTYVLNQPTTLTDPLGTKPHTGTNVQAGGQPEDAVACPNSFVAGTRVVLADGTTKPIERIRPGDQVLAGDEESGRTSPQEVAATIVGRGDKNLITVTTTDGTVTATTGHPFWIDTDGDPATPGGRWIDASELRHGHWLKTANGRLIRVTNTHPSTRTTAAYNLTVDKLHTYYVLAGKTPVLVHNCGDTPPGVSCSCFPATGAGPNVPPIRIEGPWTRGDIGRGAHGLRPRHLGDRPEIHHADQMPGSPIHELDQVTHRGPGSQLHPNANNQGVSGAMRSEDTQLHWWYRSQEQGWGHYGSDLWYD